MLNQLTDLDWGQVFAAAGVSQSLLGVPMDLVFQAPPDNGRQVKDYPDDTAGTAKYPLRGASSIVMLCKNGTGGALVPGEGVALAAAAFRGTITSKSSNTLPSLVHGVVDPFVTSVANGEHCLIVIAGMCKFKNEASGTITALDLIMPGGTTAGRFATISTTPGSATIARNEAVSCAGQAIETSAVAAALVLGHKFRQCW